MAGELEALLQLVVDAKITAAEAAPIVAALQDTIGPHGEQPRPARDSFGGRRISVSVAREGRPVVSLAIPLAAAGSALDQVPGLSPDHRERIVEAIQSGIRGPILEVSDHGDEVRIVIE